MKKDHLISNGLYDLISQLVKLVLPGVGTLYFTLGEIWGLPRGEEVVGTCAAVAVFLGIFLQLSKRSYNNSDSRFDGIIEVSPTENGKRFELDLQKEPSEIVDSEQFTLKVVEH